MNTDDLEEFIFQIKWVLRVLIALLCLIVSGLVFRETSSWFYALLCLLVLSVIGFLSYRHYVTELIVNLKVRFLSPIASQLNNQSQAMLCFLDMTVTGKMLPVTRDEFMFYILLLQGHQSNFYNGLTNKENRHLLEALHSFIERRICEFRNEKESLAQKIALERLHLLKDQLPKID